MADKQSIAFLQGEMESVEVGLCEQKPNTKVEHVVISGKGEKLQLNCDTCCTWR